MKRVILIILCLLLGIGLLAYPSVSNYLAQVNGSTAIQEYDDQIGNPEEQEQLDAQRVLAEEYNAKLTGQGITDPFVPGSGIVLPDNYKDIMDFGNTMMAYLEIPKINVYIPIYHGVSEEVLQKGVGHMSETAFPIGGDGNHTVLTGHTGLPNAKLFTDLVELEEGDKFYIHSLGETLAYEIDQIKVVLPDNTSDLIPIENEDHVTLITCTPYAVNSHRLLVRGVRTEFAEEELTAQHHVNRSIVGGVDKKAMLYGAIAAVIVLFFAILFLLLRKKKEEERRYTSFADIAEESVNTGVKYPAATGPKHHARGTAKVVPPEKKKTTKTAPTVTKQAAKTAPTETKRVAKSAAKAAPKGPQHAKRER